MESESAADSRAFQDSAEGKRQTDPASKIVTLDIGGLKFKTSLLTLRSEPDSMLYAMFSGKYHLTYNSEDCVFIDRDGTYFHLVLNWLRNKTVPPFLSPTERFMLRQEAEYYGLHELILSMNSNPVSDSGDQVWDYIPCTLRSIPAILAKLNEEGGVSQLVPIYEGSFHSLYGFVMRRYTGTGNHAHRPTTSSSFSQSLIVGSPSRDSVHSASPQGGSGSHPPAHNNH